MSEFNIDQQLVEKRRRLIENYTTAMSNEAVESLSETAFGAKLMSLDYKDADDRLVETVIRFALTYLEEFDYREKLVGLEMLQHTCIQIGAARLKMNMRAELIRDTLDRYVNDKESLEFMDKANAFMVVLLGLIETKYNTNEHYFKQTSSFIESTLNNCYMSTSPQAKAIYLKHLKPVVISVGPLACRHLDKHLSVIFDSIEMGKSNTDFNMSAHNSQLILVALDLMQTIIQSCFYRIHSHSRRIIQFLLKLVYSFCQSSSRMDGTLSLDAASVHLVDNNDEKENTAATDDVANMNNEEQFRLAVCLKCVRLVKMLFGNDRIRCSLYDDFKQVKSDAHLNRNFLKLIENI